MLKIMLVGLTAGPVKFRTLTWKGRRRKAPETPAIDVKKEITRATRGGNQNGASTPDPGKMKLIEAPAVLATRPVKHDNSTLAIGGCRLNGRGMILTI
jgi:hypothetical protein